MGNASVCFADAAYIEENFKKNCARGYLPFETSDYGVRRPLGLITVSRAYHIPPIQSVLYDKDII